MAVCFAGVLQVSRQVVTGHHLVSTAAVLGATAAIAVAADPPVARYFRRHGSRYDGFNDALSEHRTTIATLLTPAALYAAGLIKKGICQFLEHLVQSEGQPAPDCGELPIGPHGPGDIPWRRGAPRPDAVFGAALGYVTGRFVVVRQ